MIKVIRRNASVLSGRKQHIIDHLRAVPFVGVIREKRELGPEPLDEGVPDPAGRVEPVEQGVRLQPDGEAVRGGPWVKAGPDPVDEVRVDDEAPPEPEGTVGVDPARPPPDGAGEGVRAFQEDDFYHRMVDSCSGFVASCACAFNPDTFVCCAILCCPNAPANSGKVSAVRNTT